MNFAVSVQYVLLFQQLTQHIAARTALAETFVSYVIVSIYFNQEISQKNCVFLFIYFCFVYHFCQKMAFTAN